MVPAVVKGEWAVTVELPGTGPASAVLDVVAVVVVAVVVAAAGGIGRARRLVTAETVAMDVTVEASIVSVA